jgi:hypothetical protein
MKRTIKLQPLGISDMQNDFEKVNIDFNKIRIFGFPVIKYKIFDQLIQI